MAQIESESPSLTKTGLQSLFALQQPPCDEDFFDAASTSMPESFLSISNGTLEWSKGVEVLRDLNLNLPSRKLTFIAGPCGVGKTTLLSAMLGELELAKGTIEWFEYVISSS